MRDTVSLMRWGTAYLIVLVACAACGYKSHMRDEDAAVSFDGAPTSDSAAIDAQPTDAGHDMSARDMGVPDFGVPDMLVVDMGVPDFGPPDFGPLDLGPADLGPADLGPADLGPPDLGPADLGPPGTIHITGAAGLETSEGGLTASFTVVLGEAPTSNVYVLIMSSDPTEGTVSTSVLLFTPTNWATPQIVTVTGVNDSIIDDNTAYQVFVGPTSSADPRFDVPDPTVVDIVNRSPVYFKASNLGPFDAFGTSVAVSSDGNTIVVGAPSESSAATGIDADQSDNSFGNSGAAYVFVRTGSVWAQQAYIKASNTGVSDLFGVHVSLSSDGNTLAVSAYGEGSDATGINGDQLNDFAPRSGAVYVFARTGSTWSQEAYVKASNTNTSDFFGSDVEVSGDGSTLVATSYTEASNAVGIGGDQNNNMRPGSGAAYVFVRSSGVWLQEAYIKASNSGGNWRFGDAADLSDDGNTLAVGAVGENSNATGINGDQSNHAMMNAGAAYIFSRASGVWTQQAYVKASNTETLDLFSQFAIALSGDGATLAVGAAGEDSNATGIDGDQTNNAASYSGAVYVFTRSGIAWSQQAYLKASNTDIDDRFGWTVALSTDGNTLASHAWYEASGAVGINGDQSDNSAGFSGAVYLFRRTSGVWMQDLYVKAPNTDINDQFGIGLAIVGNGNGLVVGAPNESGSSAGIDGDWTDNSAMHPGAVYLY